MEWIMGHLQLIIVVGGAIAYWLNQRRKAKEEAEIEQSLSEPQPMMQMDDDAERTRRIQEEIRRKILERVGGSTRPVQTPPPMPETPPPLQREQPQPVVDTYTESTREEEAVAADMAMLERQQVLAEKLRELQAQRREHDRPAEVFAEKTALAMSASSTAVRGSVLADLRNPVSVRRAIVLREVLGTPVGLR
ncbi:MAG: hypothetical protein IPP19_07715 [Verrucomicrobia bacterium]|nr:hypothetical protein [Verrucomicrobiota bacterium]